MIGRLWVIIMFVVLSAESCDKKSSGPNPPPPVNPPPVASLDSFVNPLLTSGPDPWVIKKDSFYYYTHTLGNRIALWKTKKMSELRNVSPVTIWQAPASGSNSRNIWAPEIHYLDNKWYAYYTAGSSSDLATQRTFVLENISSDPLSGSWVDKSRLRDSTEDFFAIDGTVLEYNSKKYFAWSGQASPADNTQRIYISAMSNPWTLEGRRVLISSPDYSWERVGASPAVNEGPEFLINPAGKLFLIYSASGCWTDDYTLGMMRLKDGGDPLVPSDWTKVASPVFVKQPSNGAYGPGHNSFFKSLNGSEDWILYHANPASGQGCADQRSPRMQKFSWNADGSPNFGVPVKINTNVKKPAGE
ncbi:MAG TPA: glycoside hydrolase family 43 protein [Flavitalea sp.]|nr:glycoside hydrolase family 43 protein [Flavitalea sp.]